MNPVYFLGWSFYRCLFATYFRWRVYHPERVPAKGPVILASNHATFLDPPLIGSGVKRDINYMARKSLFRYPGVGWVLRAVQAVPVDRDGGGAAGLKAILDRLNGGGGIVLFPEGTRTKDGNLQPARSGIGLIVAKSEAPVVPVRVFGTFDAKWQRIKLLRPPRLSIKYGQLMMFEQLRAEAKNCEKARLKQIYQEIADQIMVEIGKLESKAD